MEPEAVVLSTAPQEEHKCGPWANKIMYELYNPTGDG